jgi:hypothetical protein
MFVSEISQYCDPKDLKDIVTEFKQEVASKYFDYVIHGTVPSGKMNTSEANTRRSGAYLRYIAHISGLIEGVHFFLETCGDDTIMIIATAHVNTFVTNVYKIYNNNPLDTKPHGLGQVAKLIEIFDDITQAEYISCHFIKNDVGQIKMIRKLKRFLQLSPWTLSNKKNDLNQEKKLNQQLMKGDACEVFSWCGDIDFFSVIANMWDILSDDQVAKDENESREHSKRIDRRDGCFNGAFNRFLWQRHGIDQNLYQDFLNTVRQTTDLYSVIRHEFIDKLYGNTNFVLANNILSKKNINMSFDISRGKRDNIRLDFGQVHNTIYRQNKLNFDACRSYYNFRK